MQMINIRHLRGADLRKSAQAGELVGVLKNRRLIGITIPVTPNWVEHLVQHNWSRILQNVTDGERAMAEEAPMLTLDNVIAQGATAESPTVRLPSETVPRFLSSIGVVPSEDSDLPPTRTVRVGDLSAKLIEQAGDAEEMLAVTHDGVLLGIVVPVTQRLIQYLVGKNMSRVKFNIEYGEKETSGEEPLDVIEQVLAEQAGLANPGAASRSADGINNR
jgi:hypothetical protein